jgi:Glycine rich protein
VSTIHVVAAGAPGAVGLEGGSAGRGARVSGDLTVAPGDTLYLNVGGAPTNVAVTCHPAAACIGGFNGGGSSIFGGGGGGASDVRTVSRDQDGSLASRLIVAGGGGGSGLGATCIETLSGGSGGAAGSDGGDGATCLTLPSAEAQAGRRAPKAGAAPGAAPMAKAGRWGRAATAERTPVALAAASSAVAAAER